MRSISVKVTLLYIFLAIINIAFFAFMIIENQLDLITENTKFRANETATGIYTQLNPLLQEINNNKQRYNSQDVIIDALKQKLDSLFLKNYIIFKEDKTILYKENKDSKLDEENLIDYTVAESRKEFMGQFYHSRIKEKEYKILFYVPLNIASPGLEDAALYFPVDMHNIDQELDALYFYILVIISFIAVFHIIFAIILHRLVIRPIKHLSQKSNEISKGDLAARVKIKSKDEFGQLGTAFNHMAQSVQDKIVELDDQNKKMLLELKMAAEVQKSIYPTIRKTKLFDIAIYHKPLMEVSGDYHDIFSLGPNRYGILIADISGHGVSAALITIMVRELFGKSAKKYNDTKELIKYVNTELGNLMNDFQKFFTAFYLIIDENKKIIYSNAGHLKTYLSRPSISKIFELDTKGFLVGVSPDLNHIYESKATNLQAGDKIILYTDGIIESLNSNEEQYSSKRLLLSIKKNDKEPCKTMLKNVIHDFHKFIDLSKRRDDETLMILELKENL